MNPHKPSDDLDAIRNGIDDVDQKILQLLAERRSFSVRAARLKGEKGSPSRDRLREEDAADKPVRDAVFHPQRVRHPVDHPQPGVWIVAVEERDVLKPMPQQVE